MPTISKEELVLTRAELAQERHSDSVYRDIIAREKQREKYEKRWFWELLQNAKDSVNNERVKVQIAISDGTVTFSHSGNPFEVEEILSLILQGSSKSDENKTGRFGTGFITTYLLSRQVQISGCLAKQKGFFNFLLDREADNKSSFFEKQKITNEAFDNSVRNENYLDGGLFQTQFVYTPSKPEEKRSLDQGLLNVEKLVPLALLLNKEIESIEIERNGEIIQFNNKYIKSHTINNTIVDEWLIDELKGIKVYTYCFGGISEISILTQKTDEGEMFLPLNHDYSRLFYAFPLLGTEDIGIPFLINSTKFDPCVERDGVYLTSGEKEVFLNKKIIADSILDACDVFSSLGANLYIKNIDQLFKFEQSKQHDWIDIAWFTDIKLEAFEILSKKTIIEINGTKKLYSLNDLKIPFSKVATNKTSYWNLLSDLKDFDIPKRDQTANWISIIENTQKLKEKDIIEHESVWILDRFISTFIEKYDHSDQLKTDLKTEEVYDWVNNLYNLIIKEKGTFPLDIKILLNENNFFCVADGMLWDEIKDVSLINIAENLAIGFKEKLISNSINKFNINGVASFLQEDAIQKLLNKINDLKSSDFIKNEKLMESNAFFLKWLITHNKESELPELKVLRKGGIPYDEEYIYERFSKSSILLSPNSYFATDYPLYSTLIRPKDCMAEIYYTILADEDFKYLAKQELIKLTPLMLIQKTNPSVRTIEQLIMDKSQLPLIIEDGKIREDLSINLEYSDFTYLTATDGYIYSRNTTQQSTLERFRFLLKEAPERDPFFEDNEQQIIIDTDKIIKFYRCLWVVRAKQLQWVNIPMLDEETNKTIFIKESPNSNNLSELLKKDESLKSSIRQIKQQKFLNLLNVGVSDMMRNTLATDELKLEWDKAITSMIASGNNPQLVQEIFNNPLIQQEYNNKLKQRKLIERNQGIGYLLEELFEEYIKLLCKDKQVDIKRKPFGSDYIITEESSDLVNDNGEQEIFVIGGCLVELKATGRDYASMTTLQAHTAAENIERYVLIVLPLDGNTPDIEYVRNNARVISDIGDRVKSVVNSYDKLEEDRDELDIGVDGVSVNIEDKNVRFRVDADIWNSSKMDIEDFMKKYFRSY